MKNAIQWSEEFTRRYYYNGAAYYGEGDLGVMIEGARGDRNEREFVACESEFHPELKNSMGKMGAYVETERIDPRLRRNAMNRIRRRLSK